VAVAAALSRSNANSRAIGLLVRADTTHFIGGTPFLQAELVVWAGFHDTPRARLAVRRLAEETGLSV
jgi:hypothetical protein